MDFFITKFEAAFSKWLFIGTASVCNYDLPELNFSNISVLFTFLCLDHKELEPEVNLCLNLCLVCIC